MNGDASILPEPIIQRAFEQGQRKYSLVHDEFISSQVKKSNGGVISNYQSVPTSRQMREIDFIDSVAKAFNIPVVIDESISKADGETANGYYADGSIHLALNDIDRAMSVTFMHETAHFVQDLAPEHAKALENFVISELNKKGVNTQEIIDKKIASYKKQGVDLSRQAAIDEIVAESVPVVLQDEQSVNKLINENRSLAEKIRDFLKDFLANIKNLLSTSYTKQFEGDIESIRTIYNLLEKGLKEAKNNTLTKSEGVKSTGIKFSQKYNDYPYNMQTVIKNYLSSVDNNILQFVNEVESSGKFKRLTLSKANQKQIADIKSLLQIDVEGFSNAINSNAIKHINKRHGINGIADNSMQNVNDIARVEYVLENYDNIRVATVSTDKVAYSSEFRDKNNNPAPMVLYSKKINGTYYVAEAVMDSEYKKMWVVTAYISKKDTVTQVSDDLKAPEFYARDELASPVSTDNISHNDNAVNSNIRQNSKKDTKFSLKDSEGNNLSQEQAEYFKDSKVRDENGDLMVMYHGTVSNFTVFDREKGNAEGDFGMGFYLTNSINDVEKNYATENGADLENKIDRYAERLQYEEEYEDMDFDELVEIAKKKLITAEPNTITAYVDIKNPVVIDHNSGNETYFDIEYAYDDELEDYNYDEPTGKLYEFVEALENNLDNFEHYGSVDFWGALGDCIDGGYVSDIVNSLKENILDEVRTENGDLAINELIRMAFEDMGYDGIIDTTVSQKFKNMGLSADTVHAIAFNSNQIKRVDNLAPTENEDIRFSLKSVDDFDRNEYNNIRLSAREYNRVHSEIMTNFPNVKNTVNTIRLSSTNTVYNYILDDNYNLIILSREPIGNIHEERKYKNGFNTNDKGTDRVIAQSESRRGYIHNDYVDSENGRAKGKDIRYDSRGLSSEEQGDERGILQNRTDSDKEKSKNFSLKNADKIVRQIKRTKSEDKLIEYLAETFNQQTSVEFDKTAINKFARDFIKQNYSKYNYADLSYNLELILKNSKNMETEEMVGLVAQAFMPVYENSEVTDDGLATEYGELRKLLTTTKVSLNDVQKAELRHTLGSNWRREIFGKINLKNNAISLDSFYQELSSNYPEFFDKDLNSNEQALKILEVLDALQPEVHNPFDFSGKIMYEEVEMPDGELAYMEVPPLTVEEQAVMSAYEFLTYSAENIKAYNAFTDTNETKIAELQGEIEKVTNEKEQALSELKLNEFATKRQAERYTKQNLSPAFN